GSEVPASTFAPEEGETVSHPPVPLYEGAPALQLSLEPAAPVFEIFTFREGVVRSSATGELIPIVACGSQRIRKFTPSVAFANVNEFANAGQPVGTAVRDPQIRLACAFWRRSLAKNARTGFSEGACAIVFFM